MIATSSWVEMLPNVLGRPVEVASVPNVTAAGAYVTATAALDGPRFTSRYCGGKCDNEDIRAESRDSAEYDDNYQHWTEMALHLESAGM